MKIDIGELLFSKKDYLDIEDHAIFSKEEYQNTELRDLKNVKIKGRVSRILESFEIKFTISGIMVLPCSVTLEDVNYAFSCEDTIIIDENGENNELIEGNTIDLTSILWQNIIMEIPLKVEKEGILREGLRGEGWKLVSQEDSEASEDPRLAKLKDYLDD